MIRKAVLAAGLLAGLAAPALADISFPSSFTTAIGNGPTGGVFQINPGPNELDAIDGSTTGYQFFNLGSFSVQYFITFQGSVLLGGDLHIVIYNWSTGGPGTPTSTLDSISWVHGGENANWTSVGLGINSGDTVQVPGANDLSNYTLTGGFDRTLVDQLVLTFSIGTGGSGEFFLFDAVSNPEPGTMALFGLGALGLGGLAWRRRARNARKSA